MSGPAPPPAILLVSTADWDNPFWTNKQHVASELGRRGHAVLYIESQGLRAPTATARDLRRAWRRLRKALSPPRRVADNVWVVAPLVVPLQRFGPVRALNRFLLGLSLIAARASTGLDPRWLWTYSPLTTALYRLDRYDVVVYHAVDDIKAQPGMPKEAIASAEVDLGRRADIVFATSPRLADRLRAHNPDTWLLPNVADFRHFSRALEPGTEPAEIADLPRPRIGFVGAISGYKLDLRLLRELADLRPGYSFILIGETGEGEPRTDASPLFGAPNIRLIGPRPYENLPDYLRTFDVALMLSPSNDYTASMFPLKFFEYLAAGRPVLSTPLPALAGYADLACFAENASALAETLDAMLSGDAPPLERRLEAARGQTYQVRTDRMLALIDKVLKRKSGRDLAEAGPAREDEVDLRAGAPP